METTGYYAPLALRHIYRVGAWSFDVGTTPDGAWVVEATSTAAPRPQRRYFKTEAEAVQYVEKF